MITDQKKQVLELFAAGRKQYKLMQFAQARDCFRKALDIDPSDSPSKVYVERCAYYLENPPPEDWDGVFTMTTK
jgi:tetratricopeptide (TPR) repeat protein